MSVNPRISVGGRLPPSIDLNASYMLWAITTIAALLAGLSLIANLWIYIYNGIGAVYGWPVLYPGMNPARWLLASGLLSGFGCAAYFLKSRLDAQSRSITTVRLPERLIARTTGTDAVLDKFQCRARVEIDVYSDALARTIQEDPDRVAKVLQNGLQLAISDQITRYSKGKIEETLKLSLGECFDLLDIAGVTLLDLRQERVIDPTATVSEAREPGELGSDDGANTDQPIETPRKLTPDIGAGPQSAEPAVAMVKTQTS